MEEELLARIEDLESQTEILRDIVQTHEHTGIDGSNQIRKSININDGETFSVNNVYFIGEYDQTKIATVGFPQADKNTDHVLYVYQGDLYFWSATSQASTQLN